MKRDLQKDKGEREQKGEFWFILQVYFYLLCIIFPIFTICYSCNYYNINFIYKIKKK